MAKRAAKPSKRAKFGGIFENKLRRINLLGRFNSLTKGIFANLNDLSDLSPAIFFLKYLQISHFLMVWRSAICFQKYLKISHVLRVWRLVLPSRIPIALLTRSLARRAGPQVKLR